MRLVIADTSPINYLVLIGHIEVLPRLCEKVMLPTAVQTELSGPGAPSPVQSWISSPPPWLEAAEAPPVVSWEPESRFVPELAPLGTASVAPSE